jgi:uncharacterized protein Yka (UPF0111/DUF47 family)
MSFISRLMPREGRFFELFNQHADLVRQSGAATVNLLTQFQDQIARSKQIDVIQDLEHRADRVTHETFDLMHKVFVTPFDRDYIHRLVSRTDDILDLIQDTGETMVLYDIQSITPEALKLADCLAKCTDHVAAAIGGLRDMKNAQAMLNCCHAIDGLESDADRIMRSAVSTLFRSDIETRELIKLKAVYELLEAATDKCQDVANVIESIVLENN